MDLLTSVFSISGAYGVVLKCKHKVRSQSHCSLRLRSHTNVLMVFYHAAVCLPCGKGLYRIVYIYNIYIIYI